MMKITGLSHLFKWENLHNWWLTKYFFAPLFYVFFFFSNPSHYNAAWCLAMSGILFVCLAGHHQLVYKH